jgi:hypothetical protein
MTSCTNLVSTSNARLFKKLAFFFLLILPAIRATTQTLPAMQKNALTILREFRDTLTPQKANPDRDSLLRYTILLINITKTQTDTAQLSAISTYFKAPLESYKSANSNGKMMIVSNLSRDLALKVNYKAGGQLNLESYESLFNDAKISVLVDINGVKESI